MCQGNPNRNRSLNQNLVLLQDMLDPLEKRSDKLLNLTADLFNDFTDLREKLRRLKEEVTALRIETDERTS